MFPSNHAEVYLNTCIYNETGRRTHPEKVFFIYKLSRKNQSKARKLINKKGIL